MVALCVRVRVCVLCGRFRFNIPPLHRAIGVACQVGKEPRGATENNPWTGEETGRNWACEIEG